MDETQAVRLCQEGQKDAFRFVVDTYGNILYGTAFLMTRDRSLSQDLVQEALLLGWRGITRFRAGSNLKAWLLRILVNQVVSHRRRKRLVEDPLENTPTEPAHDDDAVEAILSQEDRVRMRAAVSELSFEHRQAVVLRYYADLSVPEIARALGWREGTVKSRLHRALRQLREILEPAPTDVPVLAGESLQ